MAFLPGMAVTYSLLGPWDFYHQNGAVDFTALCIATKKLLDQCFPSDPAGPAIWPSRQRGSDMTHCEAGSHFYPARLWTQVCEVVVQSVKEQ